MRSRCVRRQHNAGFLCGQHEASNTTGQSEPMVDLPIRKSIYRAEVAPQPLRTQLWSEGMNLREQAQERLAGDQTPDAVLAWLQGEKPAEMAEQAQFCRAPRW